MSPVTLLFSSDAETSSRLVQALTELELAVEPCPDIFTAVEWLTGRCFDVVVADWDSGPEAAFLLKNTRELKLNKAAFTLAVRSGTSNLAAEEDSLDLVLSKPLIPDQIKYALLTNDRFLGCMRAWVARGDFAQAPEITPPTPNAENVVRRRPPEQPSPMPLAKRPAQPSPAPGMTYSDSTGPLNLTFATLDRRPLRSPVREHVTGKIRNYSRRKFLWVSTLTVVFACVGCIFGQPLRVQSVFASVATVYHQALDIKHRKSQSDEDATARELAALAQAAAPQPRHPSLRAHALPAHPTSLPDQTPEPAADETLQADAHPDQVRLPSRISIPESLTLPPPGASIRTVSLRRSPSLLSQVEPVSLPEDLSRTLLVDKVQPSYPEQALKAGLQGAVVLQAWIGRDGSIRDLKLVDGSLLLGRAAVNAVKQWRYKPYLRNGVAVEAETYVTVNFRLP